MWTEYEQLVGRLVREMSSSFIDMDGRILGFGRQNRIAGASGYRHQIDASLETTNDPPWLVLVECKQWERRIRVPEVLVLAARAMDIKKAIKAAQPKCRVWVSLATTKGASSGAQTLAQHFNISLDCVRSEREYAMRLRNHVNVAHQDNLSFDDWAKVELARDHSH